MLYSLLTLAAPVWLSANASGSSKSHPGDTLTTRFSLTAHPDNPVTDINA